MNESERIDLLIKLLESNNAKAFCIKAEIPEASLSRVRNGKGRPSAYFGRIINAYPQVSKNWLYTGNGEPLRGKREKGEILLKLDDLEKEVKRLAELIEELMKK